MSSEQKCLLANNVQKAIAVIGDNWTLSIIGNLSRGPLRFCEIERAVTGVNPVTLSNRLKKLEQEKIIIRKEETLDKISVTYELTEKGRAILPIIESIEKFANSHLTN